MRFWMQDARSNGGGSDYLLVQLAFVVGSNREQRLFLEVRVAILWVRKCDVAPAPLLTITADGEALGVHRCVPSQVLTVPTEVHLPGGWGGVHLKVVTYLFQMQKNGNKRLFTAEPIC